MLNLRLLRIPSESLGGTIVSRSSAVRERKESACSTPEIIEPP
jgi:hypothetical protein